MLGRLNPEFFLGGRLQLDPGLSETALDQLGTELGRDPLEVASSMVRIANENMANAIRIVTVEQGIDPRELRDRGDRRAPGRRTRPRSPTRSG